MTDLDDQTWSCVEQLTGLWNLDWIVLYARQDPWTQTYIGQLTGRLESGRYDLMYGNKRKKNTNRNKVITKERFVFH